MKKKSQSKQTTTPKRAASPDAAAAAAHSAVEHQLLLQELVQVHQIELETQNRELRETQRLLEVSRDRYADLYDFAPIGYVILDGKGLIQEINLTAASMLGIERARLVGLPFALHVGKADLPAFHQHLLALTRSGDRAVVDLGLAVKGRGAIQVELQSVPLPAAGRGTHLCRSALTDITARKQAEEDLRRNVARLNRAQEIAHLGSYEIALPGAGMSLWSMEAFRILGRDPAAKELTSSEYLRRIVHPEDRARVSTEFRRTVLKGARFEAEYRIVRPDGSVRQVHGVAEPVPGPDGKVVRMVASLQDITKRRSL